MKHPSKRPAKIGLTLAELRLAKQSAFHGYRLLQEFFRHDDWDHGLTASERHASMRGDRQFIKTIKMLNAKINALLLKKRKK